MVTESPKIRTIPRNVSRFGYLGFVVAGISFAIMGKFADAGMFAGLAMVFDPFDTGVPFPKRPMYQRVILLASLVFTLVCFLLAVFR